jgi:hypothetical protein
MTKIFTTLLIPTAMLTMLITLSGCRNESQAHRQLAEFARQTVRQQSELTRSITDQSAELTQASKELVAADALARQQMIATHGELQQQIGEERNAIDGMRAEVVQDQRVIAAQRHRDPIIATAIENVGFGAICALPLVVCWLVIRGAHNSPITNETCEVLLLELAGETDRFGPPQRRFTPLIFRRPSARTLEDQK